MSKIIELPDPLFAEIDRYAVRAASSPVTVLKQAWHEFSQRHAQEERTPPTKEPVETDLLTMVRSLRGSISLPSEEGDEALIADARLNKYGPL